MGKTKKKNADFQKLKFKVGKKLPKGLNVTDTSFKAKKIVIRNQLRSGTDSVGNFTNKKPIIKDYLNRLSNYNPTTRQECVMGLKDLLVSKPEGIIPNLAGIIEKTSELIVDREARVRESVLSLLNVVFKHVAPNHMTPFFPIISSYLSCAMTHIVADIRHTSLSYVDLLLEKYPQQTVTAGSQILNNFLDQISVEKESSSGVRTLSITPNSSLSSQTWRINVLNRMEKFLTATIDFWKSTNVKGTGSKITDIRWDGTMPLYVALYESGPFKPKMQPQFTLKSTDPFAVEEKSLKDAKTVKTFISVLIPLLKETWFETQSVHALRGNGQISKSVAETIHSILQLAYLLGEWAEVVDGDVKSAENLECFQRTFTKDFLMIYIANFPYSVVGTKQGKESQSQISSLDLNLTLCKLYSVTVSDVKKIKNMKGHCHDKVVDYLTTILAEDEIRNSKQSLMALSTVKKMVDYNLDEDFCSTLLAGAYIQLQKLWKEKRKERKNFFDYFVSLCLLPKYTSLLSCKPVKSFLGRLPHDIISEATDKGSLEILLANAVKIAPRGYESFLISLQENDAAFIKLLSRLQCTENEQVTIQRYLIQIILAIPKLNLSSFQSLSEILRQKSISFKNVTFLLQVLLLRCFQSKRGFDQGHFLSLLLCLQTGLSYSEYPKFHKLYNTNSDWNYFRNNTPEVSRFIILPSQTDDYELHTLHAEEICQLITQFPDTLDVDKASECYLTQLFSRCHHFPIHSVAAILNLASALNLAANGEMSLSSELNYSLVELALAGLVIYVLSFNLPEKLASKYRCDDYLEAMFGFINNKECASLLCQVLLQQIEDVEALSDGETDCLGAVIVEILKSAELQREGRGLIGKIMAKLQSKHSIYPESKRWYVEACELLKYQRNDRRNY